MSRTRKLIIAFWILIVILLIWQFRGYDAGLTEKARQNPEKHFFFYPPGAKPPGGTPAATTHSADADVQQTGFMVENDAPGPGSFTCHVTLQNKGLAKAVGVQINVRPYRGAPIFDDDVAGRGNRTTISDDDPLSKFGEYVTFPDLAPGESSTQSVSFISRPNVKTGANPQPEIIFKTEKLPPRRSPADQ